MHGHLHIKLKNVICCICAANLCVNDTAKYLQFVQRKGKAIPGQALRAPSG